MGTGRGPERVCRCRRGSARGAGRMGCRRRPAWPARCRARRVELYGRPGTFRRRDAPNRCMRITPLWLADDPSAARLPPVLPCRAFVAVAALALARRRNRGPGQDRACRGRTRRRRTTALVPGEPVTVALRLAMEKGWHTYWQNPGDSGLPTTLAWTLPAGLEAGPIEWPAPHALPVGPLVNYGYEGEVLHLVAAEGAAHAGRRRRRWCSPARAEWLVCKETCIPEGADLTLALPVRNAASPDPRWGAAIAAARAALPQPLAGWQVERRGPRRHDRAEARRRPRARPIRGDCISSRSRRTQSSPPGRRRLTRDGDAYVLHLPVATTLAGPLDRVAGVVTAADGHRRAQAATIDVALVGAVVAGAKPAPAAAPALNLAPARTAGGDGLTLALAVVSALLGGLILNLMPCVFPVLTIKVLGFATHNDTRPTLRREAVAFAAGVVLTFVALGVALAVLRAAGEAAGLGIPAAVAGGGQRARDPVFRAGAEPVRRVRVRAVGPVGRDRLDLEEPHARCLRLRRPRGRHRVALHGAVHGRGARVRHDRHRRRRCWSCSSRSASAWRCPMCPLAWFPGWRRRLPRPGPWLERFKQAAGVPAVRDRDLACLGARRAARQRRAVASAGCAARRRLRACGHGASCAPAARGPGASPDSSR